MCTCACMSIMMMALIMMGVFGDLSKKNGVRGQREGERDRETSLLRINSKVNKKLKHHLELDLCKTNWYLVLHY